MIRDILRPRWTMKGIKKSNRSFLEATIVGLDTETYKGKPYTFQIQSDGIEKIVYVNEKNVTEKFLDCIYETYADGAYFFVHNLEFDLVVLFYPYIKQFVNQSFEIKAKNLRIKILCGKVNYAEITLYEKHYRIIDTFAFFKTSLQKLAETFKLSPKLLHPAGLGSRKYTGKDRHNFEVYAIRDSVISREIGEKIVEFHQSYDSRLCISAPQLSAEIFKKHFIEDVSIPANPADLDEAACLSYHGGKNGMYVKPGIYKGVRVYDINSAYPYAMKNLPNFAGCDYEWVACGKIDKVSMIAGKSQGIVSISGYSNPEPRNLLRNHKFQIVQGDFKDLWITTYELDCILRNGFVEGLSINEAYLVRPGQVANPLKKFAETFYALKQETKGTMREFYKIILNSLYGKFIQNVRGDTSETSIELIDKELREQIFYQAGGLWNPLIATMITGFVRAYLTDMEMNFNSLHSSTDSIMTMEEIETNNEMGGLSLKAVGTALLLRPKLYVVWNKRNEIVTFALHGYHGSLKDFISMMRSGKRTYCHFRMTKVKESMRQNKQPLVMEKYFKRVNLAIDDCMDIPPLKWEGKTI